MSKQIGLKYQKLAEFLLLERCFVVSETLGDYSPYDLIAEKNGRMFRIQVRSTHRKLSKRNRGYKLLCSSWNKKDFLTKKDCDIIFAIAGDNNIYYIIPIEKIKQRTIILHPNAPYNDNRNYGGLNWEKYRMAWRYLEL